MTKPKAKVKKAEPDKESETTSTPVGTTKQTNCTQNSTPPSAASSQKGNATAWFTSEIQAMMHGFGDCRKPLFESARVIEEIVHQQINSALIQLTDIATLRGARLIGLEDVIFLLRKDKVKLSRLVRYLAIKEMKGSLAKSNEEGVVDDLVEYEIDPAKSVMSPNKKRLSDLYNFICTIDQTGELATLFEEETYDEVKHERESRAEVQSRNMDLNQYLEYVEARRSNFARKCRINKFRDWVLKDNVTEMKPNASALEVLNYLAYETVAQIVDLTLLVKQDSNIPSDDLSRLMPFQCFNTGYPSVWLHQANKAASTSATPPQSPRCSTSPPQSPGILGSPTGQTSHPSTGNLNSAPSKPKPKKRKKSDCSVALEIPNSQVISPCDIREAIRRYWQPVGPLCPFSKVSSRYLGQRLLCS